MFANANAPADGTTRTIVSFKIVSQKSTGSRRYVPMESIWRLDNKKSDPLTGFDSVMHAISAAPNL